MRRDRIVALLGVVFAVASRSSAPLHSDPLTTSRLHWVTDGTVSAATILGDAVYVAGRFSRVAPSSAAVGTLYPLSASSGAFIPGIARPNGEVYDVEPDGAGGYYVAGNFEAFGGLVRAGLARIRPDGDPDTLFVPPDYFASRPVTSVVLGATAVFAIDSGGLTAADPVTGALQWRASDVRRGKVLLTGTTVIAYGRQFNGTPVVAAYDQTSGARLWQRTVPFGFDYSDAVVVVPRVILGNGELTALTVATGVIDTTWTPPTTSGAVNALAVVGSTLYVGGSFSVFGGAARSNMAAVNLATMQLSPWAPVADGAVLDLLDASPGVYVAGEFTTLNGAARDRLALVDAAGIVQPWQSSTYATRVRTLAPGSVGVVLAGGAQALNESTARSGLAAFSLSTDSLLPWAPTVPDYVSAMLAAGDRVLIHRNGPSGAILEAVDATTATSVWSAPQVTAAVAAGGAVFGVDTSASPARLVKLDPTTGTADNTWRPTLSPTFRPVATDGTSIVFASGNWYVELDGSTGATGPWREALPGCYGGRRGCEAQIFHAAIDGSTLYLGITEFYSETGMFLPEPRVVGVDRRSGLRTVLDSGRFLYYRFLSDMATVDGRLLITTGVNGAASAVSLIDATGAWRSWGSALTAQQNVPVSLTVSPTDVVVSGVERFTSDVIQGVAVLPRQAPTAPHGLTWSAFGNRLTMRWTPPAAVPVGYTLEAGSAPGLADLALIPIGPVSEYTADAPTGTFYVRVRATGVSGDAAIPSNEVAVSIGCSTPPRPPTDLVASVAGVLVGLQWVPPPTEVSSYVLEAGSTSGATNIATLTLGERAFSTVAPLGAYFVRVRAVNACGRSAPSAEVFFRVGVSEPLPAAPVDLTQAAVGGVALSWTAVPGAVGCLVEAGSAPRLTDLARVQVVAPELTAAGVSGVFHVRVRAIGNAGLGPPGPELVIRPGLQ